MADSSSTDREKAGAAQCFADSALSFSKKADGPGEETDESLVSPMQLDPPAAIVST
jgi:hypothetical protein